MDSSEFENFAGVKKRSHKVRTLTHSLWVENANSMRKKII